MSPDTVRLHLALIKLLKGVACAWEEWVRAKANGTQKQAP